MANIVVQRAQQLLQRMIGYSAGLPQGTMVDKVLETSGVIPLRGEAPGQYQSTGTTVRVRGFERHPVVQACTRAIVDLASAVPLQWYTTPFEQPDDITVLPRSFDGSRLTETPSSFLSAQRLRAMTFVHYLIYGNALWFLERPLSSGKVPLPPTSIRIIHPEDLLTVYVNVKGYPIWYVWRDVLGYPHTSPVTDIMHFRDLNAKGFVFGFPRAVSALNDIIGDDEASQHVREVVTNAGMPPAVVLTEGISLDDARIAEEHFHQKMVVRGNRGRSVFLGGVKDVKSLGFNLNQLEFPDLRRVAREDICAAFGVDPRMVGITSASKDAGLSGEQYESARKRLIQQTIEPLLRAFESELNQWLAPEFGDVYMRYDPDVLKALVEDDTQTSLRVQGEVTHGLLTLEEGREQLGYERDLPVADTLAVPTSTQIIPTAVALLGPPESTDATPVATDEGSTSTPKKGAKLAEKDLQSTSGLNPNDPTKVPKITDGAVAPEKKRSLVLTRSLTLSKEQRQLLWSHFDQRAVSDEAAFKRQALLLFAEERANVTRCLERAAHTGRSSTDAADTTQITAARQQLKHLYKTGGTVEHRWMDQFHSLIGTTYAKGAEHVASSLTSHRAAPKKKKGSATSLLDGINTFDFHLTDPTVQGAIQARAKKLARSVGRTTGDAFDDVLSVGLREGMSIGEIAKLIDKTVFGTGAGYRSTMIARTETVGALNQGQFDQAKASKVLVGKEWLTQGDDKVRDTHAECEADGMIEIDAPFTNGLLFPGDPDADAEDVINCRCTMLYYDSLDDSSDEDDANARATPTVRVVVEQRQTTPAKHVELIRNSDGVVTGATVTEDVIMVPA